MTRGKTNLIVCDCTFKTEDHWVSLSSRRKHRQKYPRRSQLSHRPLSSLNQLVVSSGFSDDGLDDYEHEGDMLDDRFQDQWPAEECVEDGLGIYDSDGVVGNDSEAEDGDGGHSEDVENEEDEEDDEDSDDSMVAEGDVSEEEQVPRETDELTTLKSLSSIIHSPCI
jgi:hypothetical protein